MVDRVDRRTLLIIVSGAQAVAAAGLLLLAEDRIWVAFVFQGMVAALAAFVKPAIDASIPNLARHEDELRKANALMGSTWGVMLAVGAGLGGLFSQAFGRRASIIADVATFVIAGLVFSLIKRPMQGQSVVKSRVAVDVSEHPIEHAGTSVNAVSADVDASEASSRVRPIADMREAIAVARGDPVILALMASKATFAIGAGVVSQLAVLASDVFDSGDRGRGFLLAARGVGSGLGPLIAARWARGSLRRVLTLCGWASIGFAVMYTMAAWAPALIVALTLVCLAHLGGGAQWMRPPTGYRCASTTRCSDGSWRATSPSPRSCSASPASAPVCCRRRSACSGRTAFAGLAALAGTVYVVTTRGIRRAA